jgi:phytoene dehydrogenase-like protein
MPIRPDILIIGAGHNGLVAAILLARAGLSVTVLEEKATVGGAVKTEYPFKKAPDVGVSSGAYLLGLAPPELLAELGLDLPLVRRDPHYFLPTTDRRYLLFGSDAAAMEQQFRAFFSEADWRAHLAMNAELAALREDLAPAWLAEPFTVEETAERFIRPALRQHFVRLCRGSAREYLDRFGFASDLLQAMYAVTDAFSGVDGGYDTPGTGHNFMVHNMCRLPQSGGTWMIVRGGMGTITRKLAELAQQLGVEILTQAAVAKLEVQAGRITGAALSDGRTIACGTVLCNADPFRTEGLVGREHFPADYLQRLDGMRRDGTTLKVNLCLSDLPRFTCLPEDRGQFGPTIHLLPDEEVVIAELARAYADTKAGRLPMFPSIEWYIHSAIDPSLRDARGRHNSALFVQWVPYALEGTTWEAEQDRYVAHLLTLCDRFAPGTSALVEDTFVLHPPKIEQHFGISRGHIHHVDNTLGFTERHAYRYPIEGLYSCSAGCHPAGSVIGAAGHNAAKAVLRDMQVRTPG